MFYKLLLLFSLLFFAGCGQQSRGLTPHSYDKNSHTSAYSLEALDARYRQGL